MKTFAIISLCLIAGVQGFAPASQGRAGTQLSESIFDKVIKMDLFEPVKDQNNYGARSKKNVSFLTLTTLFLSTKMLCTVYLICRFSVI
jgi:hypothetical protein